MTSGAVSRVSIAAEVKAVCCSGSLNHYNSSHEYGGSGIGVLPVMMDGIIVP